MQRACEKAFAFDWVTIRFPVPRVPGSNIGSETTILSDVHCRVPQPRQAMAASFHIPCSPLLHQHIATACNPKYQRHPQINHK